MLARVMARRFRILWIAIPAALAACTDLSAVREWSTTSMQAAQFNEIVGTYKDTPQRLVRYDPGGAALWQEQAQVRAQQAEALELQLDLVAEYMGSLAALSADSASDYAKDVKTLTASIGKTGQVSEATVGAAGKLAATLLNAAAQAWQKRKVAQLIEEANPPLQQILAGELHAIVDRDFRRDIAIEASFLDRYFEDLLRVGGGSDPANAALNEWFILRKQENARRAVAVDAYLGVLEKIAAGHQKLFDGRNDLDAAGLAKDLFQLAKEIRSNIKDIVKASG